MGDDGRRAGPGRKKYETRWAAERRPERVRSEPEHLAWRGGMRRNRTREEAAASGGLGMQLSNRSREADGAGVMCINRSSRCAVRAGDGYGKVGARVLASRSENGICQCGQRGWLWCG